MKVDKNIARFASSANARLIAAAPTMLKALQSTRLMLYAWKGARKNMGLADDHGELNDAIAEVEAAIKATGEELEA